MSRVDVLAVLDHAASDNDCPCGHASCGRMAFRRELLAARAAVADLIDATKAADAACTEAVDADNGSPIVEIPRAAWDNVLVALERCGVWP